MEQQADRSARVSGLRPQKAGDSVAAPIQLSVSERSLLCYDRDVAWILFGLKLEWLMNQRIGRKRLSRIVPLDQELMALSGTQQI
jgi:hypothetical protein